MALVVNPRVTQEMIDRAVQVKRSFSKEVMALADVTGFGIGGRSGPTSLAVFLRRDNPKTRKQVLELLAGYLVDIEIAGSGTTL